MSWWQLCLLGLGLSVPSYFLWTAIHEFSHLIAAKLTVGVESWSMKLWPHMFEGTIRWGAVNWEWKRNASNKEFAFIFLAPRIPDIVAAILFPITAITSGVWFVILGVFFGAGLVDFTVGSIGRAYHSDLMRASNALEIKPMILRVVGFTTILISIAIFVIILLGR